MSSQSTGLSAQRVVFAGASITEARGFATYLSCYDFRKVIHFDFDKIQVWKQVAALKPDMVLVKECGAYFYTKSATLDEYENCML